MKANELRIGICVYSELFEDFTIVDKEFLCTHSEEVKFWDIPLTEEWLVKLGYDLISQNHYAVLGHLIWKLEDRFYCDKNGVQLKYVHQLQNLYFALTDEELQIIN